MIVRVAEQAIKSALDEVLVATDDERIFNHVNDAGIRVVMTSAQHHSGTDRCLEAYKKSESSADVIINIQGDEPFIAPGLINRLAACASESEIQIATTVTRIKNTEELFNPNKVKVVVDNHKRALLFSRQAIPMVKDFPASEWLNHNAYFKHIGMYAYKSEVLKKICSLLPSSLEVAESLEQLRWMQNGFPIHVIETGEESTSIDTPEDLQKLLASMKQ